MYMWGGMGVLGVLAVYYLGTKDQAGAAPQQNDGNAQQQRQQQPGRAAGRRTGRIMGIRDIRTDNM